MSQNLLTALHRWASRQDENFITDAFAHLLQRLLTEDRAVGIQLLRYLTDKQTVFLPNEHTIDVRTQVTVAKGRPDIAISSLSHLIYVEAKVESGLGDKQLERYLEELGLKAPNASTLVILSRYPVDIPSEIRERVVTRRWYQIAHWLHDQLKHEAVKDVVNLFLVKQLVEFFEGRNISMEKVGPEMVSGIHAFRSLIAMIAEAITARRFTMKDSFGREWAGYYFGKGKQDFFLGVYYERPQVLTFETYNFAVAPDAATKLGFGKMTRGRWEWRLPLDSEECNFFALDRKQQMERVAKFLDESTEAANKIRQEK